MGLNTFLIFMSSYQGLGPKKQFWPIRLKLSKDFRRQLFHYAEHFPHELLSNIHQINCPTPVGYTKIIPLTCCVISLAQYTMRTQDLPSGQPYQKRWPLSNPNRPKRIMNKHKVKHHRNSVTKKGNREPHENYRIKTVNYWGGGGGRGA